MWVVVLIIAILVFCGAVKYGLIAALVAGMVVGAVLTNLFRNK